MNPSLVGLELRKNRLTLAGLAASFALVPPLALLVGPRQGVTPAAAVESGFMLWVMGGLPFSALIIGATSGAGLRAAENRDAEAPLPQSPLARVGQGLVGAAAQLLLLGAATVAVGALISPGASANVFGFGEAPRVWAAAAPWRALFAGVPVVLLVASFVGAYAFGHAVAGGLVAVVLCVVEFGAIGFGLAYEIFFTNRIGAFAPLALTSTAAGLAALAVSLRPLAERFERSRPLGFGGGLGAAMLFLAGALVAVGAEESVYRRLRSSLRLQAPTAGVRYLTVAFGPALSEQLRHRFPAIRHAGALASRLDGSLVWISPEGRTVSIFGPSIASRSDSFAPGAWTSSFALWDKDGRLFAVRENSVEGRARNELWIGRPAEGMTRVAHGFRYPSFSETPDGTVQIGGLHDGSDQRCVFDPSLRPVCAPGSVYEPEPRGDIATTPLPGEHAWVSGRMFHHQDVGGRRRAWPLPGRLVGGVRAEDLRFPYLVGGKPAWFVPVQRADDQGVAVCRADGRVDFVWKTGLGTLLPIGGVEVRVLPDGTLVHDYGYDYDVVDPDGNFLPPIKTKKLFERWPRVPGAAPHTPRLVRRAGGHAWFVFESDRLVEMEEGTGMPVRDWPLPAADEDPVVLDGGVVVQGARGSPWFVGWDGATRELRAP